MNCRYCGAPLNPEVKFCSTCGRSQDENASTAPPPPPPSSGDGNGTNRDAGSVPDGISSKAIG